MRKTTAKAKDNKQPDAEDLGKMLISFYENGYINRKQAYKMSFIKGVLSGLGGVIGATIVLGLLLWLLSLFSDLPLIGKLVENLNNTIQSQ